MKKCKRITCNKDSQALKDGHDYCSHACRTMDSKFHELVKKIKEKRSIKHGSDKRAKEQNKYKELRFEFLRSSIQKGLRCQVTGQRATQIHYMRGRIGKLLLDTEFWLLVSAELHEFIERNPEYAKQKGWSLYRLINYK